MKVIQENDYTVLLRFEKGERFPDVFQTWLREKNREGAFFYGIGGATIIRCSFYDLKSKEYRSQEFSDNHFEILQITGNVARFKDGLKTHAHLTFAGSDFKSFGGHLDWLEVGGTLELFITKLNPMTRKVDKEVGIALLQEAQNGKRKT